MTIASVVTPRASAAISTILVVGGEAEDVCAKLCNIEPGEFRIGRCFVASVTDGKALIDEVLIGCENEGEVAINCHGNPIIAEKICNMLVKMGVRITDSKDIMLALAPEEESSINIEADLYKNYATSLDACKLILNQKTIGLAKIAQGWKDMPEEQIQEQANEVLKNSEIAKRLLEGVKIAILGKPNAGKSTLLNRLAGQDVAIVTDIQGTTRDWISTRAKIGNLDVEFIDTAGLDNDLSADIDARSQQKTIEIAKGCDIAILLVQAGEKVDEQIQHISNVVEDKPLIVAINKIDIAPASNDKAAPNTLQISALRGENIDRLCDMILKVSQIEKITPTSPIGFTQRQINILQDICDDATSIRQNIADLLFGVA